MYNTESVVVKLLNPTKRKRQWLDEMADNFSQSVQLALDYAHAEETSSRDKIHKAAYHEIREQFGLPADYTRMAINSAVSLARSYYGMRRSRHFRRVAFPKTNGSQGIGLGVNAYKVFARETRWVLRMSTGKRGQYVWVPLCVPEKYQDRIEQIQGDAKMFQRGEDWYVMLPLRVSPTPAIRDGELTFIGVDLGVVRTATISTPDGIIYIDGKEARHKREHFADLRRRYQRANRLDKVKAMRGKERRWMRDRNHKISAQIIEIALQYDNPVIVFESLDGIRNRLKGSKRFNRMMSSWAFRELISFVEYKSFRHAIPTIFVDPRGTSKTCSRCGHESRYNRRDQGHFRCTKCGFQENADGNASNNISARGSDWVCEHGLPVTARAA